MSNKHEFLVCYDYGQGGIWAVVAAMSRDHFESQYPVSRYPHLFFFDKPPGFVDMDSIRAECFQDIDLPHTKCWENMLEGASRL